MGDVPSVVVLGRFPPPVDGQTMATERLAGLLETSHDVLRLNTEPPSQGYVAAEVRFRPERVRHYLSLTLRLRRALRERRDAPVLWPAISPAPLGHWRDVAASWPAFAPGQRVFGVLHRMGFERLFQHRTTAPTAHRLVRRLSALVFLTDDLAERCAAWVPVEKRRVIPNTVDEALDVAPAEIRHRQADPPSARPLRLLFLSNMMPEKGYADVLEAARLLQAGGVDLRATFAGAWVHAADERAFSEQVRAARLGDVVTHRGPVRERSEIRAMHLAADAFLLPTYHPTEAQPISIIEALGTGTPVITTRQGGIPGMVQDGREALFVPPRDPAAIAAAVARLADPAVWLRFSKAARARFEAAYSPDAVRAAWLELLS